MPCCSKESLHLRLKTRPLYRKAMLKSERLNDERPRRTCRRHPNLLSWVPRDDAIYRGRIAAVWRFGPSRTHLFLTGNSELFASGINAWARVHGIRMLVSIILSFVTILATRAPQIFKRPGRPRAFFVFKDEWRDQ